MIVTLPANNPLVLLGHKTKTQEVWIQIVGAEAEAEVHQDERGLVIIIHVPKAPRNGARIDGKPTSQS